MNYEKSKEKAAQKIKKSGQSVTLSQGSKSGPFYAVVFPYERKYMDHERSVDILESDLRALMASEESTLIPSQGDLVTVGTKKYKIVNVKELSPAGITIYYDCQLRA